MNTIKFAWKALTRFRMYTSINILGLALSLACVLIIVRYIHQELTVNHFCEDLDNTYLLYGEFQSGEQQLSGNEDHNNDPNFTDPLNDPAVVKSTRWINFAEDNLTVEKQRFSVKTIVTDSVFLQLMPYPLLAGSASLERPNDAIITRELAQRLFGENDPLGQTFAYSTGDMVTVSGVIGTPKTKSFLDFDLLISSQLQNTWARMSYSLVLLTPGTAIQPLNKKNENFMRLRCYNDRPMRLQFFPLKEFYFTEKIQTYENEKNIFLHGNSANITVLWIVTLALLLIGLFNFINIYTVMMLKRAREFGIKKVYGAGSAHVFAQIFTENLLMAAIALFLSWFLIEISEGVMEQAFHIPRISNHSFGRTLSLSILLLLPLMTAIYPFLKYNYTSPSVSIRSVSVGGHSVVSRTLFLFVQYLITFVLIVVSLFFIKQVDFMLNVDLGYTTKDVIQCRMYTERTSFDNRSDEEWKQRRQNRDHAVKEIKERMNACSLFTTWEYGENPNQLDGNFYSVRNVKDAEYRRVIYSSMTHKYIDLFNLQLKEGRLWNDSIDQWTDYQMIVNETAQKLLGLDPIETSLVQPEARLWWSLNQPKEEMERNPPYRVIGVVKDFKIGHLSQAASPLFIVYNNEGSLNDRLMAHVVPGKKQEAIAFLKKLHDEVIGEGDFEYTFLEDEIAAQYKEDRRTSEIYLLFTVIAILISCLGLFGLSLFDIQQRYREIALRKVNGAMLKEIYSLLLKKYAYVLGIAFVTSIPVSWCIITKYLEGFANKAPLSWWLFAVAGVVTAVISLATLLWQVRRAAMIHPAKVLKGE